MQGVGKHHRVVQQCDDLKAALSLAFGALDEIADRVDTIRREHAPQDCRRLDAAVVVEIAEERRLARRVGAGRRSTRVHTKA